MVDGKVVPYFFNANNNINYKEGKTYWLFRNPKIIKLKEEGVYLISMGFHSYNMNVDVEKVLDTLDGRHYYTAVYTLYKGMMLSGYSLDGLRYMECTIPKGTTYYENEKGEIVSRKIRVEKIEEIKPPKRNKNENLTNTLEAYDI